MVASHLQISIIMAHITTSHQLEIAIMHVLQVIAESIVTITKARIAIYGKDNLLND